MTANEINAASKGTIVFTYRKKPDFMVMTPGKAMFGLIGAFLAISAGNEAINGGNIQDPATEIGRGLAGFFNSPKAPSSILTESDDPSDIASETKGNIDYIIDVKTNYWGAVYFRSSLFKYYVTYVARARIINARTKSVISEGVCKREPDSSIGAPTYDELFLNQSARLKKELDMVTSECIKSLKTEMLSLRS